MEHVEQATAAPGEKRKIKRVLAREWFTQEVAASLGIEPDLYQRLSGITINCDVREPIKLTLRLNAYEAE